MVHLNSFAVLVTVSILSACGGGGASVTSPATVSEMPTGVSTDGVSTAGAECMYSYASFNNSPSVNAMSTADWICDGNSRILTANGIPDHDVGTFPNINNPNTISEQSIQET